MANTFLKAMGYEVGKSLVEDTLLDAAKETMTEAMKRNVKFYLPVDCVVADRLDKQAETKIIPVQEVPKDWLITDIGPATVTLFGEALQNAKTIVWNGPMGAFEYDAFSRGTMAMVQKVADSYALTIVGGGDTDVALHKAGDFQKFSYVSTGGGAFIELLEGKKLPGIQALEDWVQEESRCLNVSPSSPATGRCTRPWPRPGPWPGISGRGRPPGRRAEVALAPPYTALAAVAAELAGSDIRLAAQDTFWEKQGAYTGAISPGMLADVGCHYVIVGHSERRQHFGDTDDSGQPEAHGGPGGRADPHPVRRRDPGGAGGRSRPSGGGEPAAAGAWERFNRPPAPAPGPGLRAGVGHRHRAHRHPGPGPGRCTTSSAACCGSSWVRWPKPSASSTAAASPRTTPPPSWPSRISTAPWWGAPPSRPPPFWGSSTRPGRVGQFRANHLLSGGCVARLQPGLP